jgi:hypothetical protein
MGVVSKDWLARVTRQLADFIARALGLAAAGKRKEALELVQSACGTLLGLDYGALTMVDARSAVELLGDTSRALLFVKLLDTMARVDDPERAEVRTARALELLEVVLARSPGSKEAAALKAELLGRPA